MGIYDRRYSDSEDRGAGGFREALRRMFGGGDFFSWSLHLFTVFDVRVKIHLLFIVVIAVRLIMSGLRADWVGLGYQAIMMAALFTLVLLHEFGHIFACRKVGGEANEILMWPLGGLAMASPPHNWRASFITTVGGPAVNLLLWPVLAAAVLAVGGGWGAVVFNPFDPVQALIQSPLRSWWEVALWWTYYINIVLLAFNVLLPMFPMDGGRMLQELLWARRGYRQSMVIAVNVGLVAALIVGVFGIMGNQMILFAIALFAGLTCYGERKKLEFMEESGLPGYDFDRGYAGMPGAGREGRPERESERKYREAQKKQERERKDQAEVDRILEKVHKQGMQSLTWSEKRTLRKDTERKRNSR